MRFGLRLLIIVGVLAVATTAWSASDSPGRCATLKAKGTGIGLAAALACQAAGTRTGRGPSSKCLAGAADKLRRLFAKADAKGSCGAPDDAATIADGVAAFTEHRAGRHSHDDPRRRTVPTSTTTSTTPGPAPANFSADVQPIFTANCALAGCDAGPAPEERLDLSAGRSYAPLVNVDSRECGQSKRVRPGRPDASYILLKLAGPRNPASAASGCRGTRRRCRRATRTRREERWRR